MAAIRKIIGAAFVMLAAGCGTLGGGDDAKWAAHGYLTPGPNDHPEVIGNYATEAECRAAVDAWMSRQVVGNPVSGECLPIDPH